MLPTVIFLSIMTVVGLLFLLKRILSWKNILRFALPIDVAFSVAMICVAGAAGSITGMAVAVTSGVLLSAVLHILKVSQRGLKSTTARRRPTIIWKEV